MRKKEFIAEIIPSIQKIGSRFGQGFKAGFNSGLGPGFNPATAPGAATRADAAALYPEKMAFDIYSKMQRGEDWSPESIPPEIYLKVQNILKSNIPIEKNWDEYVANKTSPYSKQSPQSQAATYSANAPVNPQVADYLYQASRGQKVSSTGNEDLDKILKAAGILK